MLVIALLGIFTTDVIPQYGIQNVVPLYSINNALYYEHGFAMSSFCRANRIQRIRNRLYGGYGQIWCYIFLDAFTFQIRRGGRLLKNKGILTNS